MQTCVIYGFIAACIAWFFMYLDTRLLDNPKTKQTYAKNMLLVGSIVGFGIYLIGEQNFEKAVGITQFDPLGGSMGAPSGMYGAPAPQQGSGYAMGLDEEIMTGNPNF
jgi:hypothetical protein